MASRFFLLLTHRSNERAQRASAVSVAPIMSQRKANEEENEKPIRYALIVTKTAAA